MKEFKLPTQRTERHQEQKHMWTTCYGLRLITVTENISAVKTSYNDRSKAPYAL